MKLNFRRKMNTLLNSLKTSLTTKNAKNSQNPSEIPDNSSVSSIPARPSQTEIDVKGPVLTEDNNEKKAVRPAEFANKLFGMAVKASSKLQQKATNLSTITLIGNIEKERLKFISELRKDKCSNEKGTLSSLLSNPDAQKHIISISADAKNFTEEPPVTIDLESDVEEIKICAIDLFSLDPRLKEIRFSLVPKQVSEEKFWRNYAYKLSLVKKVLDQQKSTAPKEETATGIENSNIESGSANTERKESIEDDQETLEKELLNDLDDYEVVNGGAKNVEDDKLVNDELNKEIDALLEDDGTNSK